MGTGSIDTGAVDAGVSDGGGAPEGVGAETPTDGWLDSLSADVRSSPTINKYGSHEEVARALINAQKFVGGEKIPAPREDWSDDDWSAHYERMGRPETPADYDLGEFAAPEGMGWSDELQGKMLGVMHEHGANSQLVQAVLSTYAEEQSQRFANHQSEVDSLVRAAEDDLKKTWGDSFEAKREFAQKALREGGVEEVDEIAGIKLADGRMLGDHPGILKVLAALGERVAGEHGLVGGEKGMGSRVTKTPGEATREKHELKGDQAFMDAYMNKNAFGHEEAVRRWEDLTRAEIAGEGEE
jgi:hypothetical protein